MKHVYHVYHAYHVFCTIPSICKVSPERWMQCLKDRIIQPILKGGTGASSLRKPAASFSAQSSLGSTKHDTPPLKILNTRISGGTLTFDVKAWGRKMFQDFSATIMVNHGKHTQLALSMFVLRHSRPVAVPSDTQMLHPKRASWGK